MKVPRNLSGKELVIKLKKVDYEITRQTGSHIRLTTQKKGTHHITIPNHNPLKIGTLSAILKNIAEHFQISKEEFLSRLF